LKGFISIPLSPKKQFPKCGYAQVSVPRDKSCICHTRARQLKNRPQQEISSIRHTSPHPGLSFPRAAHYRRKALVRLQRLHKTPMSFRALLADKTEKPFLTDLEMLAHADSRTVGPFPPTRISCESYSEAMTLLLFGGTFPPLANRIGLRDSQLLFNFGCCTLRTFATETAGELASVMCVDMGVVLRAGNRCVREAAV